MSSHWRVSLLSGTAIGVVATAVLTWLLGQSSQAMLSAFASVGAAETAGALAGAFWLLLALGVILVAVVFAAQFHPLISAVPAAWFLVVYGPALFGALGPPDWYPGWLGSYFFQGVRLAGPLITGILVGGTVAAYVRRRLVPTHPLGSET